MANNIDTFIKDVTIFINSSNHQFLWISFQNHTNFVLIIILYKATFGDDETFEACEWGIFFIVLLCQGLCSPNDMAFVVPKKVFRIGLDTKLWKLFCVSFNKFSKWFPMVAYDLLHFKSSKMHNGGSSSPASSSGRSH